MTESKIKRKIELVARHSSSGPKTIIVIPKDRMDEVRKLRNPVRVILEEII